MGLRESDTAINKILKQTAKGLIFLAGPYSGSKFNPRQIDETFGSIQTDRTLEFETTFKLTAKYSDVFMTMSGLLGNPQAVIEKQYKQLEDPFAEAEYWDKVILPEKAHWQLPRHGYLELEWSLIQLKFTIKATAIADTRTLVTGFTTAPASSLRNAFAAHPWNGFRPASLDEEHALIQSAREEGFIE